MIVSSAPQLVIGAIVYAVVSGLWVLIIFIFAPKENWPTIIGLGMILLLWLAGYGRLLTARQIM